jgi:hypothetical protein
MQLLPSRRCEAANGVSFAGGQGLAVPMQRNGILSNVFMPRLEAQKERSRPGDGSREPIVAASFLCLVGVLDHPHVAAADRGQNKELTSERVTVDLRCRGRDINMVARLAGCTALSPLQEQGPFTANGSIRDIGKVLLFVIRYFSGPAPYRPAVPKSSP